MPAGDHMPARSARGGDYDPRTYDPRAFDPVAVTVDVVALTLRDGRLHVLLVRRGEAPFAGRWALPGGFVRPRPGVEGPAGEEDLPEAAARELAEETGLAAADPLAAPDPLAAADPLSPLSAQSPRRVHLEQLGTYGTPGRDPRMRVISVAYLAFAPDLPDPTAGGDAAAAVWAPLSTVSGGLSFDTSGRADLGFDAVHLDDLAFDHGRILADGIERARSKIEYTPLATAFVGEQFTISELREVYTIVWGRAPHAANFHRKLLSVPGFLEDTGTTTERGGNRGGRRARLYRAGPATLLYPALLRPSGAEPGEPVLDAVTGGGVEDGVLDGARDGAR
ncbi:8-oxo-dGTP diphosphatase [Parafrankia irregularis]|uniref:8-oxo-dGTP diphosphatase n=1 Tax=Parafrankia irregularis TaxID=795642 RepID=A0A0S4QJ04_9ACTN|nr:MULTISPECIES: NUDIX domain-containing protein [Parafrankia]MBE3203898.1 NUDIX hydrolase [Parafrankia sp. CH37]CUU55230.1 8-oxo-dGTP diphosphatase [Parafrankia irregularis]